VVLDGERDLFDQRQLEFELFHQHSIRVIRQAFEQLRHNASLTIDRTLYVQILGCEDPVEISTVYYRAGSNPPEYSAVGFSTRPLLEQTKAFKCPSLSLQLAGCKKIRQVLTCPGILESIALENTRGFGEFSARDIQQIRNSWVKM